MSAPHLENPPLRTVSLARSKELQQLRNRRYSTIFQLSTPPRTIQPLIPNSCPAKLPTDWGMPRCELSPLNLFPSGKEPEIKPVSDMNDLSELEPWKCEQGDEQPLDMDEGEIETPLRTSMFSGSGALFVDFDGERITRRNLHRNHKISISTTRQSLPRDVSSWYYSPIMSPDSTLSLFGATPSRKASARRNGTIKLNRNRTRTSTLSQKSTSTTSSVEIRPGLRKKSTKRRAQVIKQEKTRRDGVRLLPPVPPSTRPPAPLPISSPSPLNDVGISTPAIHQDAMIAATTSSLSLATSSTATVATRPLPALTPSPAPTGGSSILIDGAAPLIVPEMKKTLMPPLPPLPRPKRRPLPIPPTQHQHHHQQQHQPQRQVVNNPVVVLPKPVPAVREIPHLHHSFLTISTDSSGNSPIDLPVLIGMVDNIILAR